MTFKNEQRDIEARFKNNWASTTSVKYDNVDFTPTPGESWVEIQVHTGDQIPVSLGGVSATLYRGVGIISINIHTALNIGSQTGKNLADTAAAIFRGQTFSGITCRGANISRLGESNGWYVYNMSVPYFRDESF
jgi:hypothetical protein